MKNEYEIRGEDTVIFLKKKDGTILETLIDTADLPLAQSIRGTWYANWDKGSSTYYVKAGISRDGKVKKIPLHRFLCGEPKGLTIDHENHDTLDNRRSSNLRVLTIKQNQQNRKTLTKNGERGLRQDKRSGKWYGQVRVDGKLHHTPHTEDRDKAIEDVRELRKKLLPYALN